MLRDHIECVQVCIADLFCLELVSSSVEQDKDHILTLPNNLLWSVVMLAETAISANVKAIALAHPESANGSEKLALTEKMRNRLVKRS